MSDEQKLLLFLNELQKASSWVLANWYPNRPYNYGELQEVHTLVHDTCELVRKLHKFPSYVYKSVSSKK